MIRRIRVIRGLWLCGQSRQPGAIQPALKFWGHGKSDSQMPGTTRSRVLQSCRLGYPDNYLRHPPSPAVPETARAC